MTTEDKKEMEAINEFGHLNYFSSLSTGMIHFNPKDVAKIGLTTMIKIMAQMKNLRRGHTSQGIIKKVEIESSNEGYANFMAPGRMQMIKNDVEMAKTLLEKFRLDEKKIKQEKPMTLEEKEAKEVERKFLQQRVIDAEKKVYNNDILKPKADTFLTAEWNEMIPFPTSKSTFSLPASILRTNSVSFSMETALRRLRRKQLWRQRCQESPT